MPATSLQTTLAAVVVATASALGISSLADTSSSVAPQVEVLAAESATPIRLARGAGAIADALATTTTTAAPTTTTTTTTTAPPTTVAPTTTAPPTTVAPTTSAAPPPPPPPPPPTTAPPPPPPPPTTAAPAPQASSCLGEFHAWINQARGQHGVAGLAADGGITHVPRNWSQRMAQSGNLAHNPDYFGQIRSSRPQATQASENVGYSTNGTRAVFDGFMASTGHRNNILDGRKTHVTAGCVVDGSGRTWVTVNFWG